MHEKLIEGFRVALNSVKRASLSVDEISGELYLGGDLGIDSIEMLEIWFRLEKALEIMIPDDDKRDIYTVDDVLNVLNARLSISAPA